MTLDGCAALNERCAADSAITQKRAKIGYAGESDGSRRASEV